MSILQGTDRRWWELFNRRQAAEHDALCEGLGRSEPRDGPAGANGNRSAHPWGRGPANRPADGSAKGSADRSGNGSVGDGERAGRGGRREPNGRGGAEPDPAEALALRILATHTACGWARSWPPAAREQLLAPLGLTAGHFQSGGPSTPTTFPAGVIGPLLFEHRPANGLFERGMRRAAAALPLALPTETLLSQAGDHRIIPDPETGLNRYGCRPCPTPGVAGWGSCSANSPTPRAFDAAEACRRQLLFEAVREEGIAAAAERCAASIRAELAELLELDAAPACRIVLTPSGTDAEYLCTLLAMGEGSGRLVNLVVAPKEIGSGSGLAAAGEHISNIAPAGGHIPKGDPLDGFPVDRLTVESIGVRDASGLPRAAEDVAGELEARIEAAVKAGEGVLLHLVDSSKTGLTRPTLGFAEAMMRRHGERVRVVVDAAQGRFEPATLRRYLQAGCMVILSGSKFYAGPSFSGAVLVPAEGFEGEPSMPPPRGLADYLSRADLPEDWRRWRTATRRPANPALLMRWRGALAEMRAYHAIDAEARAAGRARLEGMVHRCFEAMSTLVLEPPTAPAATVNGAPQGPSIFTFSVRHGSGAKLGYDAAREVYQAMSRPAVEELPGDASDTERRAASRLFNIGQPLCFGGERYGAFRVAVSAPMVTRLLDGEPSREALQDRLNAESRELTALLTKLAALARAKRPRA